MKKALKASFFFLMLALIGFIFTKTSYFNRVAPGTQTVSGITSEISSKQASEDQNFGKYDAPVYITIFKFISSFLPFEKSEEVSSNDKGHQPVPENPGKA